MSKGIIWVIVCLALIIGGCSGDSAKELFETAELEVLQNNPKHAQQLYQELLQEYPDSPYAAQAKERLADLQAQQ